ncbi:MAG TPA: membrane protein insertase YidC [Candidatus Acidoferrales bacterium]|nr:membrane protein insertase YidC [Candidatus Acidoferrales bacterium]
MSELSDQARGVIFVVIALAVLLVWVHYFSPSPPKTNPAQQHAATTAAVQPSQHSLPKKAPEVAPAKPVPAIPAVRANQEQAISIDSPIYQVEMSNRGAVVTNWRLKKYLDDATPPRPLDLVNSASSQELGWPLSLQIPSSAQLESQANEALYQVSVSTPAGPAPANQTAYHAPICVSFHFSDGHLDVTKTLNFTQNYQLTVDTSVSFNGEPVSAALAWRGGFGDITVQHEAQLVQVFYNQSGKVELLTYKKVGASGNQSQPAVRPGPLEFTGIEDQFFAATFIPDHMSNMTLWDWSRNRTVTVDGKQQSEPIAEMAAGTTQAEPLHMRMYVGPKDLALLRQVHPSLEALVNFGWTTIIGKPLLFVLQWLHKFIPNYGWAIVALTLIINFAVFPLKMKSWRSMQRMQSVMPEIRSIQDRYKKYSMTDPRKRKMNEEVMAVYSREGINPMGSCLPMLLQMPIWWALWEVLRGAIELRHAPWIFWIHDLSVKDPYYILPIAMTITMYLMTKMTPQTAVDPAQQKMMNLMPVMFGIFFFTLSSGLNLYMFTSNLVGVGQQYYLNRTRPLPKISRFKKKKVTAG